MFIFIIIILVFLFVLIAFGDKVLYSDEDIDIDGVTKK